MKLLLMIRVLSLVRGVLYWRPQIASAQSAASDVQNGGIEGIVYIRTPAPIESVIFNAKKKLAPYFDGARKGHVTEQRTA
jgi:hypothetical protein